MNSLYWNPQPNLNHQFTNQRNQGSKLQDQGFTQQPIPHTNCHSIDDLSYSYRGYARNGRYENSLYTKTPEELLRYHI